MSSERTGGGRTPLCRWGHQGWGEGWTRHSGPSLLPHLPTYDFQYRVSGFHQQTCDYKGIKPERPFTKLGGTRELKVGVGTQAAGVGSAQ